MSESFSGHDLETGLLQRLRQWRDLFPGLVLLGAVRPAVSPLFVGLVLVSLAVCQLLPLPPVVWRESHSQHAVSVEWVSLATVSVKALAMQLVRLLLLLIPAAAIIHAGAMAAAGKSTSCLQSLRRSGGRYRRLLGVLLVLTVAIVVCWATIYGLGLLGQGSPLRSELLGLIASPIAFFAGLVIVSGLPAGLLALAAVVVERDEDTIDALSRGYEYTLRRFFHLLGYLLISCLLASSVAGVAWLACRLGLAISGQAFASAAGLERLPLSLSAALGALPIAVAATALLAQTGGIYLLLRQSANGQEIEDLSTDQPPPAQLPQLPQSPGESGEAG